MCLEQDVVTHQRFLTVYFFLILCARVYVRLAQRFLERDSLWADDEWKVPVEQLRSAVPAQCMCACDLLIR